MSDVFRHSPPQFFVTPSMLEGNEVFLTGDAFRHAAAQRLSKGEIFWAVLEGTVHEVEVTGSGPGRLTGRIIASRPAEVPPFSVHLYAALLKGDKFDLVVEKTTELGVSSITPLITNRTVPRLTYEKVALRRSRWEKIARAASEQCKRFTIPRIADVMTYRELMDSDVPGIKLLAHERREISAPLEDCLGGSSEVSILIGPEGGFDEGEAEVAFSRGFRLVSLGPYVLRAETASVAAVALVVNRLSRVCFPPVTVNR